MICQFFRKQTGFSFIRGRGIIIKVWIYHYLYELLVVKYDISPYFLIPLHPFLDGV